ncbi:hypothetical protein RRG08_040072 [Elysia crispata]|uniref:Uncharacterized protein n=1 Tax=Elysia crispata TaxID=231223 RepID=A0AAE0XW02_9GAST|nr:hypothetical protein RRG08_040072 [Elysia crispata]
MGRKNGREGMRSARASRQPTCQALHCRGSELNIQPLQVRRVICTVVPVPSRRDQTSNGGQHGERGDFPNVRFKRDSSERGQRLRKVRSFPLPFKAVSVKTCPHCLSLFLSRFPLDSPRRPRCAPRRQAAVGSAFSPDPNPSFISTPLVYLVSYLIAARSRSRAGQLELCLRWQRSRGRVHAWALCSLYLVRAPGVRYNSQS